jgi:lipopolysaccharide transport system permease protein
MTLGRYWMLVDQMARMSLKADASRYFLGYIWWILEPILFVGVFYVVFELILQNRSENFLVFLMCGKFTFIWFSKSVNHAARSIVGGRGLIGKLDLPKSLFPVAQIHEDLYKQALVFVLLFAVVTFSGFSAGWHWLWLLPIAIVNYLMIVACGLTASILVCLYFDFTMVVQLGMMFLLFVSGIFWDPRALPNPATGELVMAVNPLAFMVDAYRQVLMAGVAPDAVHLAIVGLVSGAAVIALLAFMKRYSRFLALKALTS